MSKKPFSIFKFRPRRPSPPRFLRDTRVGPFRVLRPDGHRQLSTHTSPHKEHHYLCRCTNCLTEFTLTQTYLISVDSGERVNPCPTCHKQRTRRKSPEETRHDRAIYLLATSLPWRLASSSSFEEEVARAEHLYDPFSSLEK